MTIDWWLPEETWKRMKPEEQMLHCIKVRAYFLSLQRKQNGTPGSPESDWQEAELEEIRRHEAFECRDKMRATTHDDDRVRNAILFHVSNALHLRPKDITDETTLPVDYEVLWALGDRIGFDSGRGGGFRIPKNVTTVGGLLGAVCKTPLLKPVALKW